jgi:octaprenyl-diphosphate synthase
LQDGSAPVNALDRLANLVGDDMAAVNRLIVERMHSPVPMIPQLAGHIVAAGGKRLRPLLTLAAARMCGYGGAQHVGLAACVEFIHTATLLHDDVVDESGLRRGRDSANAIFGNQASVLVGDFLFSRSFQLMVDAGSLEVLAILANAAATIAEGEVLQLTTANDPSTTEKAYYAVIRGKTASLFAAAVQVGALVAGRPKADADALGAYGMNLGLAFQIVDDVLDYDADQAALGKTVGDDFREGKATLPILLAYERGSADERAFWYRCIADEDQRDGDLETAIDLLRSSRALTDSAKAAQKCVADAKVALQGFNGDAAYGQALADVADFCVDRAF